MQLGAPYGRSNTTDKATLLHHDSHFQTFEIHHYPQDRHADTLEYAYWCEDARNDHMNWIQYHATLYEHDRGQHCGIASAEVQYGLRDPANTTA